MVPNVALIWTHNNQIKDWKVSFFLQRKDPAILEATVITYWNYWINFCFEIQKINIWVTRIIVSPVDFHETDIIVR